MYVPASIQFLLVNSTSPEFLTLEYVLPLYGTFASVDETSILCVTVSPEYNPLIFIYLRP